MLFEWDEAKSVRNKIKHGISFEEVRDALEANGVIAMINIPNHPDQKLLVFRSLDGKICSVATERRGDFVRLISAHEDRKMRKIYDC